MKIIGITGGVGAGKTQILEYLNNKYGATVCQADKVAKKLQQKGGLCYDAIISHCGEGIRDAKGELNRSLLADIVFNDQKELEILNGIVHPAVKEEIKKKIAQEERRHTNIFIIESALLIEDNYDEICDELWYIYVKDEIRKKRLIFSRGYDAKKVDEIIAAQLPKDEFLRYCDRVIDNSGVFAETMMQLDCTIKDI